MCVHPSDPGCCDSDDDCDNARRLRRRRDLRHRHRRCATPARRRRPAATATPARSTSAIPLTGCGFEPIAGCCNVDADCDDANACTTDTCDTDDARLRARLHRLQQRRRLRRRRDLQPDDRRLRGRHAARLRRRRRLHHRHLRRRRPAARYTSDPELLRRRRRLRRPHASAPAPRPARSRPASASPARRSAATTAIPATASRPATRSAAARTRPTSTATTARSARPTPAIPGSGCQHTAIPGCCASDGDCDDGDVCTGLETCNPSHTCEPGHAARLRRHQRLHRSELSTWSTTRKPARQVDLPREHGARLLSRDVLVPRLLEEGRHRAGARRGRGLRPGADRAAQQPSPSPSAVGGRARVGASGAREGRPVVPRFHPVHQHHRRGGADRRDDCRPLCAGALCDAWRVPAADRGQLRDSRRFAVHAGARLHVR